MVKIEQHLNTLKGASPMICAFYYGQLKGMQLTLNQATTISNSGELW